MTFNNAKFTNKFNCGVKYLNDNISVSPIKRKLYRTASLFVTSPLTKGRLGLFILSISISNKSLTIMLIDITETAFIELTMNLGEVNKYFIDGFTIHPPVKDKNKVGIMF